MKILFDHHQPLALAHGGVQIQIQQTKAALEQIGVRVEFLRWWDETQKGDLIHFFGNANNSYLHQARFQKMPVVMTSLFSETCNRSDVRLACQRWLTQIILGVPFGESLKQQLAWRTYANCDHNVVGLDCERRVLQTVYRIEAGRISVVPLGLSESWLRAGRGQRTGHDLICPGTIRQQKNCVELAAMARLAQAPVLFIGKPYHPGDPYWLRFKTLIDNQWVKYRPHVSKESEMIALLQSARGFVLMSNYENWSLVAHEAAACGLPLLVPDQKWSRERFGDQAHYFKGNPGDAAILHDFYQRCPSLLAPKVRLYRWTEVAEQLRAVYAVVLRTSR